MPQPQKIQDEVFTLLVGAACRDERCPQMHPHGPLTAQQNGAIADLARAGFVRLELYALNWRVIEIRAGEHKGKRTAKCPHINRGPYKIIRKGDVTAGQRGTPSKPLPYGAYKIAP